MARAQQADHEIAIGGVNRWGGFSLIEIWVALFLASLLMSGLITFYLQVESSNRLENALADIQERARFTLALLGHRTRLAGYARCENSTRPIIQQGALMGYSVHHLPSALGAWVDSDSDAIVVGECVHYKGRQRFLRIIYYLSDTRRKNSQGQPIIALYEKVMGKRREELTAGIAQMRILYGLSAKDHRRIVHYETANHVRDWSRVSSVKIALLFRSMDPVLRKSMKYGFNGKEGVSTDHRLYKPWMTYITLRERG